MSKVVIIGAGGHTRSLIANLQQNKIQIEGIYDSGYAGPEMICGVELLGFTKDLPHKTRTKVVIAVGDNSTRAALFAEHRTQIFEDNLVHPTAKIEDHIQFGVANQIFAKTYVNNGVRMQDNNLINTGAILEHEVRLGSHNHVSVGAILLGRSEIGDRCFIGSGAIIRDRVKICDDVTVGANSYVSADITEPGIYVGSPAERKS